MSVTPGDSAENNEKALRFATNASVITASLLILIKLVAWLLTGSVGILASLVDSVMDGFASMVNMIAVRYSLTPADSEHRFGHGKAEPLAGLVQASFICGSAIFLLLHAVDRLQHPQAVEQIGIGLVVMVISILLTVALLLIQNNVINKTGSTAIKADALHYTGDVLSNLSIIVALILTTFGFIWADSFFAILIAAYISYSALQIGKEAITQLMDQELPNEEKEQIISTVMQHPKVLGVHDLKTRQSGQKRFVQLHIELEDHMPLIESHEVADDVEAKIYQLIPNAEIILHQDPVSISEEVHFQDDIFVPDKKDL